MSDIFKSAIFLAFSVSTNALACTPDPDFAYDDISSQNILLATASLKLFEIENSESGSCWNASYADAQYLFGTGPEHFFVQTCFETEFPEDEVGADPEALSVFGFETGANVVLGLVLEPDDPTTLRYSIPTCWGYFHLNLDEFSEQERNEFLQELKEQVEDAN